MTGLSPVCLDLPFISGRMIHGGQKEVNYYRTDLYLMPDWYKSSSKASGKVCGLTTKSWMAASNRLVAAEFLPDKLRDLTFKSPFIVSE